MALKFFYNGIKDNGGKLQTCYYSAGGYTKESGIPEGTITIYKRDYMDFSAGVHQAFEVLNGADLMTDYFEKNKIRVRPNHPLYAQVKAACDHITARQKRRAEHDAKAIARAREMYVTDDVEIDDAPAISRSAEDHGTWVAA